ncbi:hypothetical protein N0V86_001054 [Didymella sp. IMI 355093]|nr:hypothetical protein N0V86_001054 [Didymella sp. IMI 355093]
MTRPHPVILCGKTEAIGAVVISHLAPEFESALGTKNFEKTPVAVILGGAFDDTAIAELRRAAEGTKDVPWLRADMSLPAPPPGPEYAMAVVQRIKERVKELERKGEWGGEGVVWF